MAVADIRGHELFVTTTWVEKDLGSQVPGLNFRSARPNREEGWYGPLSWGTWVVVTGVFQNQVQVTPVLANWLEGQRTLVEQRMLYRDAIETTEGDWNDGTIFDHLYPYQQIGATFIQLARDGVLIADEMGTGKTPTTLQGLARIPGSLPTLVVCPNSVKHHWATEAETWWPDSVPYVVEGGAAGRRKVLAQASEDPNALVIINFEAVKLHSRLAPYGSVRLTRCVECGGPDDSITPSRCHKHPGELNFMPWKTVVVDEAHRMKDPKSQQTRACWAVQHQDSVEFRVALTGTPIANDMGDLWSILHGVAPKDFPTRSEYISRWALMAWNQHAALDIVGVRPDTRHEFDAVVNPRTRRVLKDVVLPHLPAKVAVVREAPMTQKQSRAYAQMRDEMLAEIGAEEEDVIVSPNNLIKATRLLQFSSAYAELDHENLNSRGLPTLKLSEPSSKLDVLEEIIDQMGDRQLAVCAMSRQLIDLAAARLLKPKLLDHPVSFRMLTGEVPVGERPGNIADFQKGYAQVFLFTIAAGGVGITLTAADTIVFLQRGWSMLENMQAEDRVHRVGSERHESITIVDVIAPGTIEVNQLRRLAQKRQALEDVMQDRRRLVAAGRSTETIDRQMNELMSAQLLS